MTVDVTYVELKNFPNYVCPVDIFGVPCLLTASYNSRKGQRLISLTSYDDAIVYLKPTFIANLDRVFLNFNMLLNELNVYVTLEALTVNGVKQTSTDYLSWSSSYRLAFVSLPPTERLEGFRNLSDEEVFDEYEWLVTTVEYPKDGSYQVARYNGTRIIENKDYSSYANLDLTASIVTSFHDSDMQQWQAVKDAANELTGVSNWSFDFLGNRLVYKPPTDPYISSEYSYNCLGGSSNFLADSLLTCGQNYAEHNNLIFVGCPPFTPTSNFQYPACTFQYPNDGNYTGFVVANTYWNPREIPETQDEYLSFQIVAQKIISNASSSNEAISLLAEAYLEAVANSIYNADPDKQFVKLSDLIPQFEQNKMLS